MPLGNDIPTASISPEQAVLTRGRLQLEVQFNESLWLTDNVASVVPPEFPPTEVG